VKRTTDAQMSENTPRCPARHGEAARVHVRIKGESGLASSTRVGEGRHDGGAVVRPQ
jgi:hypothetical protein